MKLPEPVAEVDVSVTGTAKRYKFTALQRIEVGIHAVHTESQLKQAVRDAESAPDCRTCVNMRSCDSQHSDYRYDCVNGDQYKPAPAVVLWRTE